MTVSRFIAIVSSTLNVENFAMPFTYLNKLFQSTHAIDLVTLHQISKFEYNLSSHVRFVFEQLIPDPTTTLLKLNGLKMSR